MHNLLKTFRKKFRFEETLNEVQKQHRQQDHKASINWSSVMRKCVHVKKPCAWSLFIDYFLHESNLFQFIKIKMKMRKNPFQYLENFYEWMKEMHSDKRNMILNENSGIKRIHVIFLIYCALVVVFSFKLIYRFT